jgi:GWxTD domain-containing protein
MKKKNHLMNQSNFFRIVLFFISALFIACSAPKKLRENQFGSNEFYFQPLVNLIHSNNDTSIILLEFDADQLLYSRKSTHENFTAQLEVEVIVKKQQALTDTLKYKFTPPQMQESGAWREEIPLPLSFGNSEVIVTLKDLNRRAQHEEKFSFLKNNQPSTYDIRVTANSSETPIYDQYLVTGDTIHLDFPRFKNSEYPPVEVFALAEIPNLPPPAFSNNTPVIPDSTSFSLTNLVFEGSRYHFIAENKSYLFRTKNSSQLYLYSFGEFPTTTALKDLIAPLRYITSKSEFEYIYNVRDPYASFCNFWKDCGGSEEKAKELISIFFRRVNTCNTYFSSTVPGWRTDRGMIYIIYGKPTRVENVGHSERWIYGDETIPGSFSFLFRYQKDNLSDNVLILQRDGLYRNSWEIAVNTWRQGRVFRE